MDHQDLTVRFLSDPRSYLHGTPSVEVLQTPVSWIFLTERFAWKLKKERPPLSSPGLRLHACREEVRLNHRLSQGVYLGVVPVTSEGRGLHLGGPLPALDWVVWMRRLPRERFLDALLLEGTVPIPVLERGAHALARFYRRLPDEPEPARSCLPDLEELLANCPREVPENLLPRMREAEQHLLGPRPVREVHGSLVPEHLCLLEDPVFIGALDFDRERRLLDPLEELCGLALECDLLDGPEPGRLFLEVYRDRAPEALLALYRARRAVVHARRRLWGAPADTVARARVRRYLEEADRCLPGLVHG